MGRPWVLALKLAVAVAAVYFVTRKVPVGDLGAALSKANLLLLAACVVLQYGVAVLSAFRWKLLLQAPGLGLSKYLYFVFVGQFFGFVLPSSVAGEAVRVVAFGYKYGGMQQNIGIALLSRGVGIVTQGIIGAIALAMYYPELKSRGLFDRLPVSLPVLLALAGALAAAGAALYFARARLGRMKWVSAMVAIVRDPGLLGRAAVITIVIHLLSAVAAYLQFRAVLPTPGFWKVVLFILISQMFLVIPFSLGGVGVREYLNVLLFSDLGGMPAPAVLAATVIGYVPLILVGLTGGAWMLARRTLGRTRDGLPAGQSPGAGESG